MSSLVHKVFENLSHVVVIWSFFEFEVATVVEVSVEFVGQPSRQRLNCSANFFVFNTIVLIIFVFTLQSLPWKRALQEVNQNESN